MAWRPNHLAPLPRRQRIRAAARPASRRRSVPPDPLALILLEHEPGAGGPDAGNALNAVEHHITQRRVVRRAHQRLATHDPDDVTTYLSWQHLTTEATFGP